MKLSKTWLLIPVAVAVVAVLAVAGFSFSGQGKSSAASEKRTSPAQPVAVTVAPVARGEVAAALDYSGEVRAESTVAVLPKTGGRILKMAVDVGSRVQAGDLLAELETDHLGLQVQQAQAALAGAQARLDGLKAGREEMVAQAEANLTMARAKLASLEDGPRPETVAQAAANLRTAEAGLAALKKGPTPEQIAIAEAQIRAAKNQLYSVQSQGDALLGNPFAIYSEDMKKSQAGVAYEQVQLAEAQLAALKAPPTAETLTQAEAAVDAARQQLELAQHPFTDNDLAQARAAVQAAEPSVALAKAPGTAHDLRAAEAGVEQARVALELARLQLDDSRILAPIAGVVVDRLLAEGSLAGPATPILTLASAAMEVAVNVEEGKIGALSVGQAAQIAASAYPGTTFEGSVKSIAPAVDTRSRTITVKVEPRDPEGKLKPGMFAQLSLKTQQRQASLLVPRDALVATGSQAAVFVVSQDRAYRRPLKLGGAQGELVEVVGGLSEGQDVVVQGQSGLTDGQLVSVLGR